MNILNRQQGFSLIEVLVALVVLSIGLLGLAALQSYTLHNNLSANYRTQASTLAYQFIEMAKSYKGAGTAGATDARNHPNVRRLVTGLGVFSSSTGSSSASACDSNSTSSDPVRCDRARWFEALNRQLPGASARVTFEGLPNGMITVEICWTDDRSRDALTSDNQCTGSAQGFGEQSIGPDGSTDWPNNALWVRGRI